MTLPTVDQLRDRLSYDPETGSLCWVRCLRDRNMRGREVGCINSEGYRNFAFYSQLLLAHRVAWIMHYGEWPEGRIDHVNRDRQDNRIRNLRLASVAQNTWNSAPIAGARSAFKGVFWNKGRWQASIWRDGRRIHLGRFEDEIDAARAYDRAALSSRGEFAFLNFPDEVAA